MKYERYVIIDNRSTCGNSVFFWCNDGRGYTCDLRMAGIYTEKDAELICTNRSSDKMYRYSDVLKLVQHHVDCQDLYNKKNLKLPHTYSHLEVEN